MHARNAGSILLFAALAALGGAGCSSSAETAESVAGSGNAADEALAIATAQCPAEPFGCGVDPHVAEQTCESAFGLQSGKEYAIPCGCGPDDACTNSSCFANCFVNQCNCNVVSGRDDACKGVDPVPPQPEYGTYQCNVTGVHSYYCPQTAGLFMKDHTIDGWSCGDYCGAGGDFTMGQQGPSHQEKVECIFGYCSAGEACASPVEDPGQERCLNDDWCPRPMVCLDSDGDGVSHCTYAE